METLSADVNLRLLMRDGETRDEAMNRLTDLLLKELCQTLGSCKSLSWPIITLIFGLKGVKLFE